MTKDVREQIADGIGLIYCSQCKIPTDVDACPTCDKIHEIAHRQADQILALLKENGYVRLADDQELPDGDECDEVAQHKMLKAGWKKVVE